jgi:PD-(D/E)XK nuclease superfamily protein
MKIPCLNRKRRGEVAEAAFLHKASSLGFTVGKTWGESDRYDFMVDTGARVLRVQVKSAYSACEYGGYTFHAHGNTHTDVYTSADIDFLVAYIVPEDVWYILPIEIFAGISGAKIFPSSRRRMSRFEKYREAWSLMTKNV